MVKITNIPNEMVSEILDCVKNVEDLKQCQLTCKEWSTIAQERIYKSVEIHDEKHAKVFFHTIKKSPTLPGQFTKKLYIHYRYFPEQNLNWDPYGYFNLITKYLPNLQNLDTYIHRRMIRRILEEKVRGNLQQLRKFSIVESTPESTELYLAYRNILERLFLSDGATENSPSPKAAQVREYKRLMDKVEDFRDIKELTVDIFTNKSLFKLETHTAKFPHLESIVYVPFRNKLDDLTEGVITDLSQVTPVPTLKELNATSIALTDHTVAYLMHKFPNMIQLILNRPQHDSTYLYPSTMSQETTATFIDFFVSKTHLFDVYFSPKNVPISKIVKMFMRANASAKMDISLMICYNNKQSGSSYPYTRFAKPAAYWELNWPDVTDDNTSMVEVHYDRWGTVNNGVVTLPHLALLDALGTTKLKHLTIESGSKFDNVNEDVELYQREFRNSLDKVIEKCTKLDTASLQICECDLWANGSRTGGGENSRTLKNESITRLELEYAHIHHGGFDLFNQSLLSLRYLTLKQSEYFDMEKGIDMTNQILNNFTWTKPHQDLNGKVVINVIDAIGDEYKTIDQDGIESCTKRIFENASNGYDNVCIRIRCEYLKSITIAFMNFNKTCLVH